MQMGLLKMNSGNGNESGDVTKAAGRSRPGKTDVLSTLRHLVPPGWRVAISQALLPREVKEKLSLRWLTAGIAWEETRAFLISNANEGYIRVNLKGREPQGVVELGREYEELCEELYRTVKSFINPANGIPAVRAVYKTDDTYHGPCRSHMPDVLVTWNDRAKLTTDLLTETYGRAHSDRPGYALNPYYTGNHRPNAFMLVTGPDVPQGAILNGIHILDLAPTILTYFGIEPPDHLDGKPLSELRGGHTALTFSS
jgi:predicted AlkP superfamily phosphohydrolase/phosphomutase